MTSMTSVTSKAVETAEKLGEAFATALNRTGDTANWYQLNSTDNVPEMDYIALIEEFGECTRAMKFAYRQGFDRSFRRMNCE